MRVGGNRCNMETSRLPLASIIIVNHNGENYLNGLFESLSHQTFKNFEVILVDNASNDNSLNIAEEFAARRYFSLKIIRKKINLGFCEGNNVGVKIAKGRYMIFLNDDTYVENDWVEELVKRARFDDEPAVVASMIANPDNSFAYLGLMYDIYGAALAKEASNSNPEDKNLFYGSGAALLVCKYVLDQVGAFDSELFMYQDEVDLCWRIRLAGYKISYAPNAKCYHLKPELDVVKENLNMPVWKFYQAHGKNRIRVLTKNYSFRNAVRRVPIAMLLILLRALMLMAINRESLYFVAVLKGFSWNLSHFGDTIARHHVVQRLRKTSDCSVQEFMISNSIELGLIKLITRPARKLKANTLPSKLQLAGKGP
jgi:GT2 family glycosyltransferase